MRLTGTVKLLLAEEARTVLQRADLEAPAPLDVEAYVEEANDLGVWIRVRRERRAHLLLVRWDYILSLEVPPVGPEPFGFRTRV